MRGLLVIALLSACHPTKDTDTDTDVEDTDPGEPPWDWCPSASAFVGDPGWKGSIEATPHALYCSASNEGRTLEQELAAKARLRVVAGTYPLPTDTSPQDIALPVCTERPPGVDHPEMDGTGSTAVNPQSFGGTTYTYLEGSQPMTGSFSLAHTIVLVGPDGEDPGSLVLDGQENDDRSGAGAALNLIPPGRQPTDNESIVMGPCDDADWQDNVHTVTFDGGSIEIHLHLGKNTILTGPGVIATATGSLDGTAFAIDDFYRLLYRPEHHHFGRHFAVVFDPPIGDVCALRIENVDTQVGTTTATVSTAACDLSVTGTRTVTDEGFVIE
jgi:hypothetical protein